MQECIGACTSLVRSDPPLISADVVASSSNRALCRPDQGAVVCVLLVTRTHKSISSGRGHGQGPMFGLNSGPLNRYIIYGSWYVEISTKSEDLPFYVHRILSSICHLVPKVELTGYYTRLVTLIVLFLPDYSLFGIFVLRVYELVLGSNPCGGEVGWTPIFEQDFLNYSMDFWMKGCVWRACGYTVWSKLVIIVMLVALFLAIYMATSIYCMWERSRGQVVKSPFAKLTYLIGTFTRCGMAAGLDS